MVKILISSFFSGDALHQFLGKLKTPININVVNIFALFSHNIPLTKIPQDEKTIGHDLKWVCLKIVYPEKPNG